MKSWITNAAFPWPVLLVLQAKSTPPFLKSLTVQGQINNIINSH